ncbi:HAD family hydrolase [Planctomyces sp. SH-PL62]|uniref:HAD family hydrolase n=1 Tax=Planctomyces sp. SH-PL62 TaxID=1636152 RepID=UPI00078C39CC|nr:HAD family hydrolase [Planctomyces sp. SH-PL62]AMV39127.1 Phosphorylated carbohydrates phosphatase [Planctomyces sp. SH-PL62]
MPRFEAVLLDVDGTLVDSNDAHAEAWVRAFRDHGHDVSFERVRERIGKGGDKMLPELIGQSKEDPEAKALQQDRSKIFLEQLAPGIRAFPDVRDLILRMKRDGLKIVVASSAQANELETLLKLAGVDDLIEAQTSSDDAERSKPDPDIVVAAVDQADRPASQVLMLGDTPYDVQAATKAGVAVIALRSGGWDDDDLKGAIAIYDDAADLLAHYDDSPLSSPH